MDHLGLPIAFGKPQPQARDESKPTRGGSSSRGDRGVVGGGKKNRGRGAASTESRPIEWPRAENLASQYDAFNGGAGSSGGGAGFNGGVKRDRGSHQPRQEERGRGRGRGRGAPRGRGGHAGAGGHREPRKADIFHGRYLKESMWADPWEEIILARQAGTA